MFNPSLVSARSSLSSPVQFPSHIQHMSFIRQNNGELLDVQNMDFFRKALFRHNDMFTINYEPQRLVFRHSLIVNGWRVNAKLTMMVAPDRYAPSLFLSSFYRNDMKEVTTGLLVSALRSHAQAAMAENLSFINVTRMPCGAPIKNASRHHKLAAICKTMGLHCYSDELVLEN